MILKPKLTRLNAQLFLNDASKKVIAPLLWPRLLMLRVRSVAVELASLIHMSDHPIVTYGLHYLSLALSALGWVLHGLRLLISIARLLSSILPSETTPSLTDRLRIQWGKSYNNIGDDLLRILDVLVPVGNLVSAPVLLILDIIWTFSCFYIEWHQLKKDQLLCGTVSGQEKLRAQHEHQAALTFLQKRMLHSGLSLLCTSLLFVARQIIIPLLLPMFVLNPIVPVVFAILTLLITIAFHITGRWLDRQKHVKNKETEGAPNPFASRLNLGFFKQAVMKTESTDCISSEAPYNQGMVCVL